MSNKHIKSTFVHIVISPKEYQDPDLLISWLKKKSNNYVVARETGTTGHLHIECFTELKKETRIDHIKQALRSVYSSIPHDEWKNVKVVKNTIDDNPLYGYGYALKEEQVIASTLDPIQEADARDYYEKHKDRIQHAKEQVIEKYKKNSKYLYADDYGEQLLDYLDFYFRDHTYTGDNLSWLIDQFNSVLIKKRKLSYSFFKNFSMERTVYMCERYLGEILLTPPNPTPISFPNILECITHPKNENLQ